MNRPDNSEYRGRVGFCVGTGRCGTTFLAELASREPEVSAAHERERVGANFHMYCKWYALAVDPAGFLAAREDEIRRDLAGHRFSFEASALLSHSLAELFERFEARFVLLVRHPAATVSSFAARGWFTTLPVRADANLPPSYHTGEIRHFLGRILPSGREFERWSGLTQIGRIAWFWHARNRAVLDQFSRLPASHCRLERLEDLDFARYQDLAAFLGWQSRITPAEFAELAHARPNAGPNPPRTMDEWSDVDRAEFVLEVETLADALGYECRRPGVHSSAPPKLDGVLSALAMRPT